MKTFSEWLAEYALSDKVKRGEWYADIAKKDKKHHSNKQECPICDEYPCTCKTVKPTNRIKKKLQ